jgi:hypothetical protein
MLTEFIQGVRDVCNSEVVVITSEGVHVDKKGQVCSTVACSALCSTHFFLPLGCGERLRFFVLCLSAQFELETIDVTQFADNCGTALACRYLLALDYVTARKGAEKVVFLPDASVVKFRANPFGNIRPGSLNVLDASEDTVVTEAAAAVGTCKGVPGLTAGVSSYPEAVMGAREEMMKYLNMMQELLQLSKGDVGDDKCIEVRIQFQRIQFQLVASVCS